jgi:hypothetical protein
MVSDFIRHGCSIDIKIGPDFTIFPRKNYSKNIAFCFFVFLALQPIMFVFSQPGSGL